MPRKGEPGSAGYGRDSPAAAIDGFRLSAARLKVALLADAGRARYEYQLRLEATAETPARYWFYHLPASAAPIDCIRAWDHEGPLQASVLGAEGGGFRLVVRLRRARPGHHPYAFGFAFEGGVRSVVVAAGPSTITTCADHVSFAIPCTVLDVSVEMPAGAEHITSMPSSTVRDARVNFRSWMMRPHEQVSFLVSYRQTPPV